jgi:hypothetical protein
LPLIRKSIIGRLGKAARKHCKLITVATDDYQQDEQNQNQRKVVAKNSAAAGHSESLLS